jgi:hypothetical protein
MKQVWKELPVWAKGTIAIVGILAVGGVGFAIYKGVKRAIEKAKEGKEGRESKDELKDAEKEGIKPTFSEAEAQSKISTLVSAANGCDPYGQGATQIIAVMKSLKNKADYYLLNSLFGTKTWEDCGYGSVTGSLTTLLIDDLDSGQIAEVRTHLSTLGINM